MKNRGKMKMRWMSLMLCMSMLLSNVPATAFAEGETNEVVETEIGTEVQTEALAEAETEAAETETEAVTEAVTEAWTEAEKVTEAETEAETEEATEAETETETDLEEETSAETESESVSEEKTESESEVRIEIEETVEEEVSDKAAEAEKIQVDFMEYLDPVIPILFQGTEDMNVREYLINAFGIPEEISFTCSPETVAFGQYQDGDTLPITVTAEDGYSGTAAVTAEVYHVAPAVRCRVVTVYLKVKQGNTVIAEYTIDPSKSFNPAGSQYEQKADLTWTPKALKTLQTNTNYTLEVSWGAPYAEDYESGNGRCGVVSMEPTGKFSETSNSSWDVERSLYMKNDGLNVYGVSGTATSTFSTDGYGAYTVKIAMNHQADGNKRYIDIKMIFQDSGKESDAEKTVPSGSNIMMSTTTTFPSHKYEFSWTKNGVTIDGATGSSYTASTAAAGEKYVATIRRKPDSGIGCTGSESWTQTFTVSSEKRIPPTGKTVTYTGSKFELNDLIDVGYAGEGFWYGFIINDLGMITSFEDYWGYNGGNYINARTYSLDYYLAKSTEYDFFGTKAGTITFTIEPASPTLNSAPVAVTGLKYDGTAKALINVGSATNGTVQYSLDGKTWSSSIPTGMEAGAYTVYYKVKGNKNYKDLTSDSYKLTVTIAPASDNEITKISANENLVYDGTAKTLLTAEAKYGRVSYALGTDAQIAPTEFTETAPVVTNAGTYYVWYHVKAKDSYNAVPPVCKTITIAKKGITATLTELDKTYDGSSDAGNVQIALDDLVNVDNITASAETITYDEASAGERTVTAKNISLVGISSDNYKLKGSNDQGVMETLTAIGSIEPRPITIQPKADQKKIYGEQDPELLNWEVCEENGLVNDDTLTGITASREAGENAGSYIIVLTMETGENPNYAITAEAGSFIIEKKDLTVDVTVKKQFDNTITVDKAKDMFTAVLVGIVGEDKVVLDDNAVEASFASAAVGELISVNLNGEFVLSGDEAILANYNLLQPTGVIGEIYNDYTASVIVTPQGWTNGSVIVYAPAESKVSRDYEQWADSLELTDVTDSREGNTFVIYEKNADGDISMPLNVTTFIEKTAPTGTIVLAEMSWKELLSSFSFDQFFKEMQLVKIEAEDELSGIKSIEYCESDKALKQDEVEAITEWLPYNGAVEVTLEDAKKFIYYAKLTDNAGNVTYLSTDGAVYDTTAPLIEGVETGEYYTTQTVTVTDTNLDSLTLNGEPVTSPFVLDGDKDAVYSIEAADKAGNRSTVTVTMKTTGAMDDKVEDLNSTNVTLEDKEELQDVLSKADELLTDPDTTEEEKKQLEEQKAAAEELLEIIEKVEEVISDIDSLPDKTETDLSEEEEQEILDSKAAYDALSDYEKSLVSQETLEKLESHLAALVDYFIIKGDGSKWTKGSGKKLTFVANGPYRKFAFIEVDEKEVDADLYTTEEGSTVINLKASYLEKLSEGKHTITVYYSDGEAEGTFKVLPEPTEETDSTTDAADGSSVETGDTTNLLLWVSLLCLSALCLIVLCGKRVLLLNRQKRN